MKRKGNILHRRDDEDIPANCGICGTTLRTYRKDKQYAVCPKDGSLTPIAEIQMAEDIENEDDGAPILVSGELPSVKRKTRLQTEIAQTVYDLESRGYGKVSYEVSNPDY